MEPYKTYRLECQHVQFTYRLGALGALVGLVEREPLCEGLRPLAWSMCAAYFRPCISLSRATPLGRSRYHTSQFP